MYALYAIICALGITTSYTDIRFKKIRNVHLAAAIGLATIVYAYLAASRHMILTPHMAWNLVIGLGIGMALYLTDTWGAGDAKLFFVFCFLMPTEKYTSILFFPSIAIFFNIFLVSTFAIILASLNAIIAHRKTILKHLFSKRTLTSLSESFLALFALKWLVQDTIQIFFPRASSFLSFLILFLAYRGIRWMMKKIPDKRVLFSVLGLGLISHGLLRPYDFSAATVFAHIKIICVYTVIFEGISAAFGLNNPGQKSDTRLPFAPFMFIGTLAANTNFLHGIMRILRLLVE